MKPYILFFNAAQWSEGFAEPNPFGDEWIVGELLKHSYVGEYFIDGEFAMISHHSNFDDALVALEVLVKADQIKERP